MLSKENRLRKDKDFQEVFQKGFFLKGDLAFLKFKKNNLLISRFAIVAPSKVFKKAVQRNRIKRQVREIIRLLLKEKKIEPGFDIIIFSDQKILKKKYKEIEENVENSLKRAGVIVDK